MAQTIPLMFIEKAKAQPTVAAQFTKDGSGEFAPISYGELLADVESFAAGLAAIGVARGDRVGIISDNRREWLVSDLAILGLGAADVPRGCDATEDEIAYILSFSECALAILENERQLAKLLSRRERLGALKRVLLFDAPSAAAKAEAEKAGFAVSTFAEVDVLLTPTTPTAAFRAGEKTTPLAMYLADVFTLACNLAGLPGLSVPTGATADGLPIGAQLLGRPLDEATLIRAGEIIEAAAGGRRRPPAPEAAS